MAGLRPSHDGLTVGLLNRRAAGRFDEAFGRQIRQGRETLAEPGCTSSFCRGVDQLTDRLLKAGLAAERHAERSQFLGNDLMLGFGWLT